MVQFVDLAAQQKIISAGLEKRIKAVLAHGSYIMGPEVAELEGGLAEFAGAKHAVTCSSGTDALLMALMAYEVKPGDAILTTPFTFIATAEVIAVLGAIPLFVDIDPKTFNLDPQKLELAVKAVQENDPKIYPLPELAQEHMPVSLRGIIPVDLFGLPADYQKINDMARRNGLFVIGDAAQSFGASCNGKKVGTLTDLTSTSFFPAKPLGCYGDGGAVFTDDDGMAGALKSIRSHGKGKEKYDNVRIGINGRLDTLQAAVLLEKIRIFPEEIETRNRVAEKYSKRLRGTVEVPYVPPDHTSVWAQYSVLSSKRDSCQVKLKNAGIPSMVYYPTPLHLQSAFSYLGYKQGDFPVSEETSRKIFSLPMHPYLTDEDIDKIAETISSTQTE